MEEILDASRTILNNSKTTILNGKSFLATTTKRLDLNIYIIALVPEYLIKGEMTTLVGLYVTGIVSKA